MRRFSCRDGPAARVAVNRHLSGMPVRRLGAGNSRAPVCRYGRLSLRWPFGIPVPLPFRSAQRGAATYDATAPTIQRIQSHADNDAKTTSLPRRKGIAPRRLPKVAGLGSHSNDDHDHPHPPWPTTCGSARTERFWTWSRSFVNATERSQRSTALRDRGQRSEHPSRSTHPFLRRLRVLTRARASGGTVGPLPNKRGKNSMTGNLSAVHPARHRLRTSLRYRRQQFRANYESRMICARSNW